MPADATGQREGIEARGRQAWKRFQLRALVATGRRGVGLLRCGLGHVDAEMKRPALGGPGLGWSRHQAARRVALEEASE